MKLLCFDLETHLIKPGMLTPRLVCLSWADEEGAGLMLRDDAIRFIRRALKDPNTTLVGQNLTFDFGCLCADAADLLPLIFDAYQQGRIRDTMVMQKLIDIKNGELKFRRKNGKVDKGDHTLKGMYKHWFGEEIEKENTPRLTYGELDGIPLADWPEAAKKYALDDAIATLRLYKAQAEAYIGLPNVVEQHQASWAFQLMSIWGVRTDKDSVDKLKARLETQRDEALVKLRAAGLVRPDGSKDLKIIRERIKLAYEKLGLTPPTTEKNKDIQTSEEVLADSQDPDLVVLAGVSNCMKLLSTYVPVLETGTATPICARYNVLVESGRTSCSGPNLQNPPRENGVRDCFVPRPGYLFASADFDTAELRALGQVCLWLFGKSAIAEAFKQGADPHATLAVALGSDRQFAKIPNYGFPGGLGADTFVQYAAGYGVNITVEHAKLVRERWFETWPEMKLYFEYIAKLVGPSGEGDLQQFKSGRIRGGVGFCAAANSYFQGLVADGAKQALWDVTKECWLDSSSALYGSRPVLFLHDEIICEVPEAKASEAADRMSTVMQAAMAQWMPDVPVSCSPVLMRKWIKGAKTVRDENGKLMVFEKESK